MKLSLNLILSFLLTAVLFPACHHLCPDDDDDMGCPDLIVQAIDFDSLRVSCPGGGGTCVTTITFTIANVGTAGADSFNVRTTFDPGQSVQVNTFVIGLAAGATQTITAVSTPGGNCFDPDCTVTVFVDNEDQVEECNEGNNRSSDLVQG